MPVGAAIGAGVIAGAGTIGGSLISSHAQKQAVQQSNQIQQQSAADQLQLLRDLYAQNTQNFTPYLNAGYGAEAVAEQLLGLKPLTSQQFNAGQWYTPGTVDYTKPGGTSTTPSTGGTSTGTGTGSTPTPASGYTGPSLSQIMAMANDGTAGNGQAAIDAYMNYYLAHPEEDPGFASTSMFSSDGYKGDASLAQQVLTAHQNYTTSHPTSIGSGAVSGSGATGFPAQGAGGGPVSTQTPPTPAPTTQPASTGSLGSTSTLQQQAQEAIAHGADPVAVSQQLQQLTQQQAPTAQPAPVLPVATGGGGGGVASRTGGGLVNRF